ncbi:MAG: hypothetical protein Q9209_000011 [Squamulea sp. 1 TL-2023]
MSGFPSSAPLPSPQNRASASHPAATGHLNMSWTEEREERLVYVQRQLRMAQARWSEEQDLWIDEVHHLEDLKRKCLKAEKKATSKRRASSVTTIWKSKTWGGKSKNSSAEASGESSPALVDEPESMEDEIDDECEEDEESTSRTRSLTTMFRTISLSGNKDRISLGSRRNTLDGGQASSRRPSLPTTPQQSYSSAEVKGKGNLLQKRRGSGR